MDVSLDRLKKADGIIGSRLPWVIIVGLVIAMAYLYWHQAATDRVRNHQVKALQERISAQETSLRRLQAATSANSAHANLKNTGTSAKDLAGRVTGLEAKVNGLESNVQEVEFSTEGIRSDITNRLTTFEVERARKSDNRISGMENQIIDLQNDLANLKQLVVR